MKKNPRRRLGKPAPDRPLRAPRSEQLLIDSLPDTAPQRALCSTFGRGQLAMAIAKLPSAPQVYCHTSDIHLTDKVRTANFLPNLTTDCAPDLPDESYDLVAIPVQSRGDSELTRELLQQAFARLAEGGLYLTASDNPDDKWLHDELRTYFKKVTRTPLPLGVVYRATKTAPLKKEKDFSCEFAFRDQGRLIKAFSRPGVFSHRRLDGGARALMNALVVENENLRILDIGCGAGTVTCAAAFRVPQGKVLAVDSSIRALHCTTIAAERNGLTNIQTLLNATGEWGEEGSFDLAIGNPPYYSNYQIAEIFLQGAHRSLKVGGELLIVTKFPLWYRERLPETFQNIREETGPQYTIFRATKAKLQQRPKPSYRKPQRW